MNIPVINADTIIMNCPYIPGELFVMEEIQLSSPGAADVEALISFGFRHFGDIFFRPLCIHCGLCVPIRIPAYDYEYTTSAKRVLNKNRDMKVTLKTPDPYWGKYQLYLQHKKRFKQWFPEDYEDFLQSFSSLYSFTKELNIYYKDSLIGVSYFDLLPDSISIIYSFFDESFAKYSPGKLIILKAIEYCCDLQKPYLHLGYYIETCRHMRYKKDYKPNEVLVQENQWQPFLSAKDVKPKVPSDMGTEQHKNSVQNNSAASLNDTSPRFFPKYKVY